MHTTRLTFVNCLDTRDEKYKLLKIKMPRSLNQQPTNFVTSIQ